MSGWALFVSGLVLAVVLWAAVLHPLIPGIPAAWFLIRFAPTLLGAAGSPSWYPDSIGRHILVDLDASAFILTALLVAATLYSVWRKPGQRERTQLDQSLTGTDA